MYIYRIYNDVNDKSYIGQTVKSLEYQMSLHRNSMVTGQTQPLYVAMRELGWDNFHIELIQEAKSLEELDELEVYYIQEYNSIENGYNVQHGGKCARVMDDFSVQEKHLKSMRSVEVRSKISSSMKASYIRRGGPSEEHRKHLSESKKALYASEKGDEVRRKFRESFKLSEKHAEALRSSHYKAIYCIDESGKVVAEFDKVKDGAMWWLNNGYPVKSYDQLCDRIKQSSKEGKYIKGLKWVYRV